MSTRIGLFLIVLIVVHLRTHVADGVDEPFGIAVAAVVSGQLGVDLSEKIRHRVPLAESPIGQVQTLLGRDAVNVRESGAQTQD